MVFFSLLFNGMILTAGTQVSFLSNEMKTDLVVMGSVGKTGLDKILVGSSGSYA